MADKIFHKEQGPPEFQEALRFNGYSYVV